MNDPLVRPLVSFAEMDETELIEFLNQLYEAWDRAQVEPGGLFSIVWEAA